MVSVYEFQEDVNNGSILTKVYFFKVKHGEIVEHNIYS